MVEITIRDGHAVFEVLGWSKLWTLRRRITVPLTSVHGVQRADPSVLRAWWKGWRMPGTHVPGLIVAGTFYRGGRRFFWDVRAPARAIEVDLAGAEYDQLIVDVADPAAAVERLAAAIAPPPL